MNHSDHIPEHIDDDPLLASLRQQCSVEPPAELDQRIKQLYRDTVSSQHTRPAHWFDSVRNCYQHGLSYWQFFRQTPAIAATLLMFCVLTGLLGGLLLPSPWRDDQQTMQSVTTTMVLRNGSNATRSQTTLMTDPARLPADQWLELIAELLVQQRVEEAQHQLRAFRKRYPDFGVSTPPASSN